MARSAFVKTTTKRLDLHGDWEGNYIEVKENLGTGDRKKIDGSAFTSLKAADPTQTTPEEAEAGLDLGRMFMVRLKTYITGWFGPSFEQDGKPVPVSPTAIDMLDPELADEIVARLNEWLKQREADRAANPTGTTSSVTRSA